MEAHAMNRAHDALAVLTKTPAIRAFLEANDPKALEQADAALAELDAEQADLDAHLDREAERREHIDQMERVAERDHEDYIEQLHQEALEADLWGSREWDNAR